MTDTQSRASVTRPGEANSLPRYLPAIVRVLLGLMFLVFGLNGLLNFIPVPEDIPEDITTVTAALMQAGYVHVVSGVEVLVAVLLLSNRFVPLALVLLAPIIVGIITFHLFLDPATIGPGVIVLVMEVYLAWTYRNAFRPLLAAKAAPGH